MFAAINHRVSSLHPVPLIAVKLSPAYRAMNQLKYTLAACYETLRMRDLVMLIPKFAAVDTVLPYTTWDAQGNIQHHTRTIKAGSHIVIDSPACQVNPHYWTDPSTFDPTRHLGDKGKELQNGFTAFSMGVRGCIGRRFAEVEMVSLVSHLVQRYKIHPVPLDGENFETMYKRYEKGTEELSFTPGAWNLRLEKR